MALLLVPYNNAMRLGQGFNSYTQQICVDDAVVIDHERAENVLLNDGTTMRILAQTQAKPSAWTRQKEVVVDERLVPSDSQTEQSAPKKLPGRESLKDDAGAANLAGDENAANLPTSPAEDSDIPLDTPAETADPASDDVGQPVADEETSGPLPAVTISRAAGRHRSTSVGGGKTISPEHSVATEPGATNNRNVFAVPTKEAAGRNKLEAALAALKAQQQQDAEDRELMRKVEQEKLREAREYQRKLEAEMREEDGLRHQEERDEQRKIRAEKRAFEEQRRKEMYKAISDAASSKSKSLTIEDMRAIAKQNQFAERWNGMLENTQEFVFDATGPRGPSQTVTYTSRFVDRLSDITDDMCISGSLSIKAAKIGGSGRGSFIDSDKFKESDLNFYISVKVVNQTINFKDALRYSPLRSVDPNDKATFAQVYGDTFISGFQEGGEFNALVSMKILNKAKKTDIQAEAKVAFTASPMSVEAEANVGIARENIETNTETTIQVSWMGGGHIKPMEQQWDIKSLMQTAARFPDLVADCPQRTYAILTKYDKLRSFNALKPASYTPLQYENAQLYTNILMEAFISYKTLYKQISDYMFQIRGKTMEIVSWEAKDAENGLVAKDSGAVATKAVSTAMTKRVKDKDTGLYPFVEDNTRFEASMGGLDQARKAIRRQMARIVNEVDLIEKDPKLATDEDHQEPFQPPAAFEARVPTVQVPKRLQRKQLPLAGRRIQAKPQTEEELLKETQRLEELENAPELHLPDESLQQDEVAAFATCVENDPNIGRHLQVTQSVGDTQQGKWFNNLDFLREDWHIKAVRVRVADAVVRSLTIEYENGLVVQLGPAGTSGRTFELSSLIQGERIIAGAIESGCPSTTNNTVVLSIQLFTNRGRSLVAQSSQSKPLGGGKALKDGHEFSRIDLVAFDNPFNKGTLKGFFGRHSSDGISRLGCIWGNILPDVSTTPAVTSPADMRRVVLSQWGQTKWIAASTHGGRFGITYPTPPKVIYALSEVRSTNASGNRPPSWGMANLGQPDVTTTDFSVKTAVSDNQARFFDLEHSWLTLPDNEVNFNVGYHDFGPDVKGEGVDASVSYNVVFAKEYKTVPATPTVWMLSVNYRSTSSSNDTEANPRLAATISNLTTKGFTLTVRSFRGSRHAGNCWAWCVWDREYDGVKVASGIQNWGTHDSSEQYSPGRNMLWEPDFGGRRLVSIMTGIQGYDLNIECPDHLFHLESKHKGSLETGGIHYGTDWSSKAPSRWMQAMYVAILED